MNSLAPHLVLDIDGVLQAPYLKYGYERQCVVVERIPTVDVHPLLWPRNWHGYGAERRRKDHITFRTPVRVSPRLLEDLTALSAHVAMLTSWCEHDSARAFLDQATYQHRWFPEAQILPFPGRDASGQPDAAWKVTQLRALLSQDPRPFIWVDDDEVPVWGAQIDREFAHIPHLLIAPDASTGLTHDQVACMRRFIHDRA